MKGWNKLFHTSNNQRRAGMAILISDKIDLNSKTFKRQGHRILLKESICQEYITITYVQISEAPIYDSNIDRIKREIDHSITIDGYLSIPLAIMDRRSLFTLAKR